jgi:hypothetical protein
MFASGPGCIGSLIVSSLGTLMILALLGWL